MSLAGSLAGSLCLAWLLYTQVLPFSGKLGFVLFWYATFIGLYAGVTAISQPLPVVRDRVASALVQGLAAVVLLVLVATVFYTIYRGMPALRHPNFYVQDMSNAGPLDPLTQGGAEAAIIGTLLELAIAIAISLPLGLVTAVYMVEVGGRFSRVVRTVVEAMTAVPDLVAGLFIYAFWLIALHQDRSGLAAAFALSITMLPIIARSASVFLRTVPSGLREASAALGAPMWRTVWSVVLPTARPGLATAVILGLARGIGETAPVLIVSTPLSYSEKNPFSSPMNSLSLYAYTFIRAPDSNSHSRGYGAACLLLGVVIILFVVIRLLARPRRPEPGPLRRLVGATSTSLARRRRSEPVGAAVPALTVASPPAPLSPSPSS
ncbi:MAG: phosphate ABC transporter permease PstA [Jatrophihabitans endophyticus]|nr:phosphate ABC transporter permease PstA [Jatrophihabitans endophyticus]